LWTDTIPQKKYTSAQSTVVFSRLGLRQFDLTVNNVAAPSFISLGAAACYLFGPFALGNLTQAWAANSLSRSASCFIWSNVLPTVAGTPAFILKMLAVNL
jgi:hypothetical protein